MGRKNSSVQNSERTPSQYKHRRKKRLKFKRFEKRCEKEKEYLLFLENRTRKAERKEKRKAERKATTQS